MMEQDVELGPRADRVLASERDHLRAVLAHSLDLRPMALDVGVPSEDQPAATGDLWDPVRIERRRPRDRAGRPPPLVQYATWVPRERAVRTDLNHDFREAQHVGVEVVA